MTEGDFLKWLRENRDTLATPAYVYDAQRLDESVEWLRGILPRGARLFYSLKANPQLAIMRRLAGQDVSAETASTVEQRMCALAGVDTGDILVGGVAKSKEELSASAGAAGIVIDSGGEWTRLTEALSNGSSARVLVRINPVRTFWTISHNLAAPK